MSLKSRKISNRIQFFVTMFLMLTGCFLLMDSQAAPTTSAVFVSTTASQADPIDPIPLNWERLGALGIVAFAMGWLVTKVIPGMSQNFSDTIKETNKDNVAALKEVTSQFAVTVDAAFKRIDAWQGVEHADRERLNETLRQMTAFCAAKQMAGGHHIETP